MNPASQPWFLESLQLRFLFLSHMIFVNDYGCLNDERKEVWRKFLKIAYPKMDVVFV